ncbi:hypothetical protein UYO_1786 [Lachnospiraceae bacterium JC7]|nr:hypothetical protein UYO_1786 [Lachnospiraceae bacterium JC7]
MKCAGIRVYTEEKESVKYKKTEIKVRGTVKKEHIEAERVR